MFVILRHHYLNANKLSNFIHCAPMTRIVCLRENGLFLACHQCFDPRHRQGSGRTSKGDGFLWVLLYISYSR